MANELRFFSTLANTGFTVTARVYDASGAQVGADVSCPEVGTDAIYIGDMPTAAAGSYAVRFISGGEVVGMGTIEWDGAAEITRRMIDTVVDGNATRTTDILADTNELQTNQGDWATATGFSTHSAADIWAVASRTLTAFPDATLSAATLSSIATAVEQAILNEGDGEQVLNAIVGAIGNTNIDQVALVAAIRADLERTGGAIDNLPLLADLEASSALTATADISGLPTLAQMEASSALTAVADISSLATSAQITALDDLSASEMIALFNSYDIPTKAELDAAEFNIINNAGGDATAAQQSAILTAISGLNDITAADVWANAARTLTGDVTLSSASASSIAIAVEAAILSEGDGQQVIDAIVQAIGNENVTAATIATAVWSVLATDPTIANSMKDVLQIARDNAKAANAQTQP